MFRNSVNLSSRKFLTPVAATATATATASTQHTHTRRPSNLAPTWFANSKPADCSSNLKFLAISMRHVEIKSSDVVARASDSLQLQSHQKQLFAFGAAGDANTSPAPMQRCEHEENARRSDDSNNIVTFLNNNANVFSETDTTFGDPSGGESLQFTQPIRMGHRGKGQWGKPFFGKVFNQPRNFAYQTSSNWSKKFRMKKHRYTKRWQKRRYKIAALANLPFAKKLRVNMIPKLNQGKKKKGGDAGELDLEFSPEAQDAVAAAASGKLKSGVKKRYRPKSKYQV